MDYRNAEVPWRECATGPRLRPLPHRVGLGTWTRDRRYHRHPRGSAHRTRWRTVTPSTWGVGYIDPELARRCSTRSCSPDWWITARTEHLLGNPHTVVALAEPSELVALTSPQPPWIRRRSMAPTSIRRRRGSLFHDGIGRVDCGARTWRGRDLSCGTGACAAASPSASGPGTDRTGGRWSCPAATWAWNSVPARRHGCGPLRSATGLRGHRAVSWLVRSEDRAARNARRDHLPTRVRRWQGVQPRSGERPSRTRRRTRRTPRPGAPRR